MIPRPSLLFLTAVTAALGVVANGVTIAAERDGDKPAATSRLGSAIAADLKSQSANASERARALEMREAAATAAEARLKAALEAEQAKPEGEAARAEVDEGAQYEDLARIYQAMKPKRAAIVFEQLDMDVQVAVARRMRERSTAQILAAMTPKGAAALSMALARRNAGKPGAASAARPNPQNSR